MNYLQAPLIDEWPRINFEELENLEVEEGIIKIFYKSFFVVLRAPEIVIRSFFTLLTEEVN